MGFLAGWTKGTRHVGPGVHTWAEGTVQTRPGPRPAPREVQAEARGWVEGGRGHLWACGSLPRSGLPLGGGEAIQPEWAEMGCRPWPWPLGFWLYFSFMEAIFRV